MNVIARYLRIAIKTVVGIVLYGIIEKLYIAVRIKHYKNPVIDKDADKDGRCDCCGQPYSVGMLEEQQEVEPETNPKAENINLTVNPEWIQYTKKKTIHISASHPDVK